MQSYNRAIPGCTFPRLLNGRWARKQEKCWQTTCFGDQCTSSLTCCSCWNLPCNGFLLLTLIIMQSHRQNEFCANLMYHKSDPGQAGYPTLKRLHGKIWPRLRELPGLADRATCLGGSPHLSCKRDQIIGEIIWTGGLPHLSELPHLPGVPHPHVNRPYFTSIWDVFCPWNNRARLY